jgi:hypothetical protein
MFDGVNVMKNVRSCPGGTVPFAGFTRNTELFDVTPLMVTVTDPAFVATMLSNALPPTGTLPKETVFLLSENPAIVPMPLTMTVSSDCDPPCVKTISPRWGVVFVGVQVM